MKSSPPARAGTIIAFAGQKGGVGKSTAAISLAAEARERGLHVLLVDADPQGTARTWGDVASEAGVGAPTIVTMGAVMHRPGKLLRAAAEYDWVVIDCPPRDGDVQRSALMVADLAILPCGPSAADAWALASSLELVAQAKRLRPRLVALVLITRMQRRTALAGSARAVLAECGLPVLFAELGHRVAYQEALAAGQGVTRYAPRAAAAGEVRSLYAELVALATLRKKRKGSHGRQASR